jgi:hypothetical protein
MGTLEISERDFFYQIRLRRKKSLYECGGGGIYAHHGKKDGIYFPFLNWIHSVWTATAAETHQQDYTTQLG